ncbi:MAG: carbohydrate deacetylase [Candidatus Methylomirabilia bacterium]
MISQIIPNADDFGLSSGITEGIVSAFRETILTSTSLFPNGEAFEAAVAQAKAHPGLSIGVHLTLVEGNPLSRPNDIPSLVTAQGAFVGRFGQLLTRWFSGRLRLREVEREWCRQVERVLEAGLTVDKLDSHMNVHLLPGLFPVSVRVAQRYGIRGVRMPRGEVSGPPATLPQQLCLGALARLRMGRLRRAGLYTPDHFRGLASSGKLTEERLIQILQRLRPGVTEIVVHPGAAGPISDRWPSSRRYHREGELAALLSPKLKGFLKTSGIQLTTYREASSQGSPK